MNRLVTALGSLILVAGPVMYFLLLSLSHETFRGDIPFWLDVSVGVALVGVVVVVVGLFLRDRPLAAIAPAATARLFIYAALLNCLAAAIFALPVLDPGLEFPILITRWPGIYMVIAYAFFVIVGVLGMAGWGGLYHVLPVLFGRTALTRALVLAQFVLVEVGVYGLGISMFVGGYVGAALAYRGVGDFIVGASMEIAVIPAAISIFLIVVSAFIGAGNILLGRQAGTTE